MTWQELCQNFRIVPKGLSQTPQAILGLDCPDYLGWTYPAVGISGLWRCARSMNPIWLSKGLTMKTNLSKSKLAPQTRLVLVSLGSIGIILQTAAISLAQRQQFVGTRLLIPSSAYTDTFSSSLVVQNLQLGANNFTITAYDSSGNPLGTPLTKSIFYGNQFRSSNILKDLGAPAGSFGPIKVESLNNQLLSASSEVRSSQGFAGFFNGVNIDTAWNFGMILDVVDDGARGASTTYRTNLGLNAVRPGSTNVMISLYSETGVWAGSMSTTLPANGLVQTDGIVQRLRNSPTVTRGYLRIESNQPIIAWASKIDNGTDDPSFQIGFEWLPAITSLSFMTRSLSADVAQDFLQSVKNWDWKGGEETMRRTLELQPNNLDAHYNYAVLLMAQGRFPEALSEIQEAEQLDPLSQQVQSTFGKILFNAGKPDEAILRLKGAIERDPRNAQAHHHLGQIYEQIGKYTEALGIYDRARVLRGNPQDNPRFRALQASVYARMGKRSEAKRMLAGIRTSSAAGAQAYLGDKDEAFRILFGMVDEREPHVFFLKSDPQFASLQSDPRWAELLRRMNLPTQ